VRSGKEPRQLGGVPSKSALIFALAGLLSGLLRLLPRILAGLLALLPRLVALPTLLRLAFVVLIHVKSPKLSKCHLNAHHSNYASQLWSKLTKASAGRLIYFFIFSGRESFSGSGGLNLR
jgi:hypothetical protein